MAADSKYDVVHEKTKDTEHYGCWNRKPTEQGYWAKDGYRMEQHEGQMYGVQKWVWVEHVMSSKCRNYYLWETDPKCVGCEVAKDVAYQRRMEKMK